MEAGEVGVRALRDARRRQHRERIDVLERLYRAYLAALLSGVVVFVVLRAMPAAGVSPETLVSVIEHGPGVLGVIAGVAVAIGLRSGASGGPIAVEEPTVLHVLLAPVRRACVLRPAAARPLATATLAGFGVGVLGGVAASKELPASSAAFALHAGVAGAGVLTVSTGVALVAAGFRISRRGATVGGVALVGWAVADAVAGSVTCPASWFGALALQPLDPRGWPLVAAPAVSIAAAAVGLVVVDRLSLEAARQRSALVREIRFALTLQDLRTVVLLRRRLTREHARRHPWLEVGERNSRWPVWTRDWQGLLRAPAARVLRVAGLGAAAGVAMWAAAGSSPLFIAVAAGALYAAALDAAEPLAQEVDHPTRWAGYPVRHGHLLRRHLPAITTVMAIVALTAGVTAALLPHHVRFSVVAIAVVPLAAASAVAGAAGSATTAFVPSLATIALPPEAAGARLAARILWPPALIAVAVLPITTAADVERPGGAGDAVTAAVTGGLGVLVLTAGAVVWLSSRRPA